MAGITLLQKLQKLYGARAVTDRLGVTTNVQTLAQGTNNPFANTFSRKYLKKNPDGVEEASKVIMENMQFAFGNKNAKQMKNFEYNVNTLYDMKFPPAAPAKAEAQIVDLSTKKQVTGKGIDSLKDKMGLPEGVSPDSPMGKILTSQNRMNKMSQELNDLGAKTYSAPEEGSRRAVMRQILLRDRRINLPENIRDSLDNFKDLQRGGDQSMDPLTLFTKYYKRDNAKLDKLDEISRESKDAIDAADNFLVKDDTIELLDDDIGTKLKDYDGDPDAMAIGGRVGYGKGDLVTKGIPALKKLIKDKFGKKSITTADKIKQPQSALDRKMFEDFNKRNKKLSKEELDELYEEFDEAVPYTMDTVADRDRFLKSVQDEKDYMFQQYKAGRLDPKPGESGRKNFLEKKAEEAEMSGDSRLFTPDEADELTAMQKYGGPKTDDYYQKSLGEVVPDDYNQLVNFPIEQMTPAVLRAKYPGIPEKLSELIGNDTNLQRKAEAIAAIEQALALKGAGKSADETIAILKGEPETKMADGGPVTEDVSLTVIKIPDISESGVESLFKRR